MTRLSREAELCWLAAMALSTVRLMMFWLVGVVMVVPAPAARTASGPRSAIRDLHGSQYNT